MSISAEIYRYYTIKAEKAGCTEAILQACLQKIVSGADYLRSKCVALLLYHLKISNLDCKQSICILFTLSPLFRGYYTLQSKFLFLCLTVL